MTARRRVATAILAGGLVVLAVSCVERRPPGERERAFGTYRGSYRGPGGRESRFRLLLFAEPPDRLHAEMMGPVGGPRVVLDAGDGRLAVAFVEERVAYVGDAGAATFGRLLGVSVSLETLVSALAGGPVAAGSLVYAREPEDGPGLPASFEVRTDARTLRIDRTSRSPVRDTATLGTGTAPAGFEVRPLEELPVEDGASLFDRGAEDE